MNGIFAHPPALVAGSLQLLSWRATHDPKLAFGALDSTVVELTAPSLPTQMVTAALAGPLPTPSL
jgi:hypothetical protein